MNLGDLKRTLVQAHEESAKKDHLEAFEQAQAFVLQKDYVKALQIYQEILRESPELANAFLEAGYCLFCNGQPEKALEKVLRAKELIDAKGRAVPSAGPEVVLDGEKLSIKSADGDVTPAGSSVIDGLCRLGMDRLTFEDPFGCLICFKLAGYIDPKDFKVFASIGSTSLQLHYQSETGEGVKALLVEEAEVALGKALEIEPDDYISIASLGSFKLLRGDVVEAEKLSLKALEINPSSRTAKSTLQKLKE
jgi:tetratricopeptide (TPR) repeat protein